MNRIKKYIIGFIVSVKIINLNQKRRWVFFSLFVVIQRLFTA